MFQITADTITQLKDDGYDVWTISLWEEWLDRVPALALTIGKIQNAFEGVTLGDGIGLREADAIDDYATSDEREAARTLDEKLNWASIETELLNRCYVAPTYFDARGFVFHLPAFLIAELNDEFDFSFIDQLLEKHPTNTGWIELLNASQAAAIREVLELLKSHPEYRDRTDAIGKAISRILHQHP